MGHGKAVSNQEYWRVIGLYDAGVSLREISRKTGLTAERGPQIDSVSEVARAGRRPALTEREVRQLNRDAATGGKFATELKIDPGIKAAVTTVHRLLKRVDHLVYTQMDPTLPRTAATRNAVGKRNLVIVRCLQNSEDFIYTLSEYKLLFARANYGIDYVFQHENVFIYASHCIPIENLSAAMTARVYSHGRQYRTAVILSAWAATEEAYLQKLINPKPRRRLAVIKTKGALTKY
ncbi:Hypothetical protein PHPALM_6138 [Phytophthora palmivora]|uniref:Uncharacterized protein n=1 Tax=Phytophthora palmivora TaxID=4796 RepID=A0A2P4YFN3_9STRA|nr:Hypothetical protein PHPALM_6138 [Phytophthora palmivora]